MDNNLYIYKIKSQKDNFRDWHEFKDFAYGRTSSASYMMPFISRAASKILENNLEKMQDILTIILKGYIYYLPVPFMSDEYLICFNINNEDYVIVSPVQFPWNL